MTTGAYGQDLIEVADIGRFKQICDPTPAGKKRTINVRISNIRADNTSAKVMLFISDQTLAGVCDIVTNSAHKIRVYMPKSNSSTAGPIDETAVVVPPGWSLYIVSNKEDIVYFAAGFQEEDA